MGGHGPDRGDNDGGKGRGHAHLHHLIAPIAQMGEGVKERRDQHDAPPYPQHPANHPGKATDHQKHKDHRQK